MRPKIDRLAQKLLDYPNVTGYAKSLQKRRRKGRVVDEECLQIHVSQKLSLKQLRKQDILPAKIRSIPVDVVDVGFLKIPVPPLTEVNVPAKTDVVRPLVGGISVGNAAITAGTLGKIVRKTIVPDKGEAFLDSNAHVLAEEPINPSSGETRIFQPGAYDGGVETVADYYWHKRLIPSDAISSCSVSQGIVKILNALSRTGDFVTRFKAVAEEPNYIDYGVARTYVEWKNLFFDVEFPNDKYGFVGQGFAGSDAISLICKASYIKKEGYVPWAHDIVESFTGDVLHKTGRTSCYSTATVQVESAFERVSYGAYTVDFDDVIVSGKMLDPGDSGSSVWKHK